eukprot:CAMPEP_0201501284 /NCGR_PEP_ID=MMETSP0151_2-20130828/83508_1 /ASSEMBLY_ACC=CAM_ASM_000257 /TAXON_ID=200890 /ORGANISM="Paramoeba atlantica, Strain 621/1 / CCAP 1560/9" /LENGTH=525 /DNA_ID=CAMNT_0047894777 /DNA_START=654 /DNA_END=2231 /DNA_ORIENTATION=-
MATTTTDFDARFDEAFRKMEGLYQQHNQKTFHPSYPPLFKKLWCACDVSRSGFLNDRSMCDKFAQTMISNGWKDWAPSQHDISLWDAIFAIHGKISLEEFCQIAEDPNYPMPDAAQITKAHVDWKKQGGDNPGAPSTGPSSFKVIDWSHPRELVVKQIGKALESDGFFLLVNHGIPHEVVSGTINKAREFFARRKQAKEDEIARIRIQEMTRPMMKCARGYSDFQAEALNPVQGPDLKETFDYAYFDDSSPRASHAKSCCQHLGANLWPTEDQSPKQPVQLAPEGFQSGCENYINKVYKLSRELLEVICESTGMSENTIKKEILPLFEDPLVINRLIRYSPQPSLNVQSGMQYPFPQANFGMQPPPPGAYMQQPPPPGAFTPFQPQYHQQQKEGENMGAGSHVDYGALTLITADCAGLEVQKRGNFDGPWEELPHIEGAFIVNTGYVLEKLTNGLFPATRHRVQNRNAMDRHSLALFLDPHPECEIAPLKELVGEGKPNYEKCVAGHKGVRFGNPQYLKFAAERP